MAFSADLQDLQVSWQYPISLLI